MPDYGQYDTNFSNADTCIAFIDGFNVYHFLRNYHSWSLWLDYKKLAKTQLPKSVQLKEVYYFSAFATWNQAKVIRHQHYISALKLRGIKPIISNFQNREKNLILPDSSSNRVFKTFHGRIKGRIVRGYVNEEKQTDVSIAAHMVALAAKNMYDTALLVSGDTDFTPIIRILREYFPEKKIRIAVPAVKRVPAPFLELLPRSYCRLIKAKHLRKSQLDDPMKDESGRKYFKPPEWK
jgi:uncharacterized LabA/DUF88 family protein